MRALFFLQGAPASGKSTFIEQNNLQPMTLSTDAFRFLISPQGQCIDKTTGWLRDGFDATSETSRAAFAMIDEALEVRMRHEEPIIIDSTAGNRKNLKNFLARAAHYHYPVYFVNMQANLSLETLLERNANREAIRDVPEYFIENCYKAINEKFQYLPDEKVISPNDFGEMLSDDIINGTLYDEIIFTSDIHGHYSRLVATGIPDQINAQKNNASDKKRLFVFCGDYLDRGPANEAYLMYQFVKDNIDNEDIIFLVGNHERYWRKFGQDPTTRGKMPKDATNSEQDIIQNLEYTDMERFNKEANHLVRKFKAYAAIEIIQNGKTLILFANHAGIHPETIHDNIDFDTNKVYLNTLPEMLFTHGIGHNVFRSDYEIDIDEYIDQTERQILQSEPDTIPVVQIHGHRNNYYHGLDDFEYSINLDGLIDKTGVNPPVLIVPTK